MNPAMVVRLDAGGVEVAGAWNRPQGAARAVVVLAHGAGGSYATKFLAGVASSLSTRQIAVLRFNFPYREAGRKVPSGVPANRKPFSAIAAHAAAEMRVPLFIGGKSFGGRVASHCAAGEVDAAGLVFLGYPLHPPGKPEKIRDQHLAAVTAPMLFLQGTRDPFARTDLLHEVVGRLPTATLAEIEGAGHDFTVPGRPAAEVTIQLADEIERFIAHAAAH